MKPRTFRVLVGTNRDGVIVIAQPFPDSSRYVARIQRRRSTGDPYKATELVADRDLAAAFTYNVARAVANRNGGILEAV